MPDQELKVHIVSDADLSGFQQTGREADKLKQKQMEYADWWESTMKQKEDGETSAAVEGATRRNEARRLLRERAAKQEQKINEEMANGSVPENLLGWKNRGGAGGAGHEAGQIEEGLHKLRGAVKLAGPEFSELGHLMHAAFNPVALLVGGLALGMEAYFSWLEKIHEKQREMILDLQKVNEEQRRIIAIGGTAHEAWVRQVESVAKLTAEWNGLEKQIARTEETQKVFDIYARDALQNRLDGRQRELDLLGEQIALLRDLGAITQEEADKRENEVEHKKKLDEITDDITKKKADVDLAQSARDAAANTAGDFSAGAVEAKRKAAEDARTAADKSKAMLDDKEGNPAVIRMLEDKIKEWTEEQKKPGNALHWNEFVTKILEAKDEIKKLKDQIATARSVYPGQETAAASAQHDYETLKGLHDKFAAMDDNIRELKQKLIDAQGAAPGKVRDENTRFAMDQFRTILKDSGLSADDIITQGAAGADDLRNLLARGYTADGIKRDGENAIRQRNAGVGFDQGAIERLEELNRDQTQIGRLNALLATMGANAASMIQLMTSHQKGIITTGQEVQALKNQFSAFERWVAQSHPIN